MYPGQATPPRIDDLLQPEYIPGGGEPPELPDLTEEAPATPGVAQLEVLPDAQSSMPPEQDQSMEPPTADGQTQDDDNLAAVGYGKQLPRRPSTPYDSTYCRHLNNSNDAYFVYLTRDRIQMNSQRPTPTYYDRTPHRSGRCSWPRFPSPQFKYHPGSLRPSKIRG